MKLPLVYLANEAIEELELKAREVGERQVRHPQGFIFEMVYHKCSDSKYDFLYIIYIFWGLQFILILIQNILSNTLLVLINNSVHIDLKYILLIPSYGFHARQEEGNYYLQSFII